MVDVSSDEAVHTLRPRKRLEGEGKHNRRRVLANGAFAEQNQFDDDKERQRAFRSGEVSKVTESDEG